MRIKVVERSGPLGGELVGAFALGGEPAAEREAVVLPADGGGHMSVGCGVGGCVGEAAFEGVPARQSAVDESVPGLARSISVLDWTPGRVASPW